MMNQSETKPQELQVTSEMEHPTGLLTVNEHFCLFSTALVSYIIVIIIESRNCSDASTLIT